MAVLTRLEELEKEIEESTERFRNEINKYKSEIEKMKKLLKEEENKTEKWKPKKGQPYWFKNIADEITSYKYTGDITDEAIIRSNKVFKTMEECKKYWNFVRVVQNKSYKFTEQDWENRYGAKWYITYDYEKKDFSVMWEDCQKDLGKLYFETDEEAREIISTYREELIKWFVKN